MKRFVLPLAIALAAAFSGRADSVYTFTMDTTALVGNGPFALDLVFTDGGDLNNNTITFTNFAFGTGGSPSGGGTATGGASGSLASGVTITDSAFFNEYTENFTPGNELSFTIDTTNLLDSGGTPDLLTIGILDSGSNNLPTTGPVDEFLDLTLGGGAAPQITAYGSAAGSAFSLAAPDVEPQNVSSTPEPSPYYALLTLLTALGIVLRKPGSED